MSNATRDDLLDLIELIRNKANHAKDNPRIQTDKLFDIIELCDSVLEDE